MTVSQVICDFDERHFNSFSPEQKYAWLTELDARIKAEIIDTHYPAQNEPSREGFAGYTPCRPDDVLVVPAAFGEIYEAYLTYRCDNANGDVQRAVNAGGRFNDIYLEFARWFHANHEPKGPSVMK